MAMAISDSNVLMQESPHQHLDGYGKFQQTDSAHATGMRWFGLVQQQPGSYNVTGKLQNNRKVTEITGKLPR
jgi:hypothetical protein